MNHDEKLPKRAKTSEHQISNLGVDSSVQALSLEDLFKKPLDGPYSLKDWDSRFDGLLRVLEQEDFNVQDRAIQRLCDCLKREQTQRFSNHDAANTRAVDERLSHICEVIMNQSLETPILFEAFCHRFRFLAQQSPYQELVLEWLKDLRGLEEIQVTQASILAARLYLGAYDLAWPQVGKQLLEFLDHADNTVRACAAHQIGKFYGRALDGNQELLEWGWDEQNDKLDQESVVGGLPLDMLLQLIRDKEIDRPGIAGAFWDAIPKEGIDAKEWLLDVLEQSPDIEPYCHYFPCNLAFDAHERFSQDADAIRRLIDMGRSDIAILAATDEDVRIPSLKPLLIELGNADEPTVCRVASWNLAYHYHYLHPKGEVEKYVELVKLKDIHLFLLFSQPQEQAPPYAVVIYPSRHENMSRDIAQGWADRIFPDKERGAMRDELWFSDEEQWFQRGYIQYCISSENTNLVDHVIIGYRSDLPWNPKDFLVQ